MRPSETDVPVRRAAWVLGLAFAACLAAAASAGPKTFRDEMGRDVTLRRWPAARVVSLAPSITEILYALGTGGTLVGRDGYSDYPAEAAAVPSVGTDYEPSLERIVALRPDVVFTATTANRLETVQELERLGVPVFTTRTDSLAELLGTIKNVGAVMGRAKEAEAEGARLQAGLDALRQVTAKAPKVSALVVVWNDPLYVVGRGTYTGELLAVAGGRNVADDADEGHPRYSLERVLKNAPEVLVIGSHSTPDAPDPRAYWQRWATIPAVKTGRMHLVDGNLMFRPGPRAIEAARELLAVLHPELARPPR